MGQSLSSSRSEKHSSHALSFAIFDCTSDELKISLYKWLLSINLSFVFTFMHTNWHGSLKLRDHLLDKFDDLKIVFKLVDVRLHLVNGLALFSHKLFVVHDILFNSVE